MAAAVAAAAAVAKVGMINELFAPFSVLCSSIIGSKTQLPNANLYSKLCEEIPPCHTHTWALVEEL